MIDISWHLEWRERIWWQYSLEHADRRQRALSRELQWQCSLSRLKSLAPLLPLPQLRSLCLADRQKQLSNPLCNSSSYRQDVQNNLPNLGKTPLSLSPILGEQQRLVSLSLDTLDNECLGHSFQEKLSSLESAIEQLENPQQTKRTVAGERPTIVVTRASSTSRSLQIAEDEYEQLLETIGMLVK